MDDFEHIDYPYRTEYAKSGRSRCKQKNCKELIAKDELRMAIMVQSTFFDGKSPEWYHEECFFKMRPRATEGDIKHLGNLRYEDQERIRQRVNKTYKKGQTKILKRPHEVSPRPAKVHRAAPYSLDYAKSAITKCFVCKTKIKRDGLRVKAEDVIDVENGAVNDFYHIFCFPGHRCPEGGELLPGYNDLTLVDQKVVQQWIPRTREVIDTKILRLDTAMTSTPSKEFKDHSSNSFEDRLRDQNNRFYKFQDEAKKQLTKKQQKLLLEANNQRPVTYGNAILNQVADLLTFGALEKCPKCLNGQYYFMNSGFLCTGKISEWAKCNNLVANPPRSSCIIPDSLSRLSVFDNVKQKTEDRLFRYVAPSQTTLSEHAKYEQRKLEQFQAVSGKSMEKGKSVKLTVKGGLVVDPESGLEAISKVYVSGNEKYSVVLGLTDLQRNRNSFYKIQLLVSDSEKRFWVFRSWGRIVTIEANNQRPVTYGNAILNQVADLLTFGALEKCPKCLNGQYYFMNSGFLCTGKISEWAKCNNLVANPPRSSCIIPDSLSRLSVFDNVKQKTEDRLFRYVAPSQTTLSEHAKYEQRKLEQFQAVSGKSMEKGKSVKLTVKGGLVVDPESGLEAISKVYVSGNEKYSVVLGLTDLQRNRNSFYKIQLLVSDSEKRFWVFRSWGRIGTTVGGDKTEKFSSLLEAKSNFETVYLEKSGNAWEDRHNFVKKPGKLYPIDVDYGSDAKVDWDSSKVPSNLPHSTQELIKMIFNMDTMKKTMLEFDLDMEKMPLGKLSQAQIKKAFQVLKELAHLIKNKGSQSEYIDASNRFYTLIPHNFGMSQPPVLKNLHQVQDLIDMLETLLQIECAYKLIEDDFQKGDEHPLDKHYNKLSTKIEPLDHNSEEFQMVQTYVANTHGETHRQYKLEVEEVFEVTKEAHKKRYKKHLHNKRLLWHGSRTTNFVGILTNGLKIAPPDAPVSGYMFGKGVYFADIVSKSAQYCYTSRTSNTGLMLLSEVALGNMLELTKATDIRQLPDEKHSVFGKGKTSPDMFGWHIRERDGVIIPYGRPVTDDHLQSSLMYNEYIVYDESQIDTQYLVKMKFNYNY